MKLFSFIAAAAVIGAALLTGAPAEAQSEFKFQMNPEWFDSDSQVRFETPLGTKYCPQGEVYVTQKRTFGNTIDYGCMPKAQYQQMLANYHNRPRGGGYQTGGYRNTTKTCYGSMGNYGQVFASCY